MLKIKSSISLPVKGFIALLGILSVSGCGFSPLYAGGGTEKAVSGQQAEQRAAFVFIDEIADRIGQILQRSLSDRLTPLGEPENPRYRLSVGISGISTSEQAVRRDNLATRYLMTMTVKYSLYSYPEGKKLMSSSFSGRSSYDVQRSPYATDIAEEKTKERLAKIMGNDIALRVAAFLKGYKDPRDEKTDTDEASAEGLTVDGETQTEAEDEVDDMEVFEKELKELEEM